MHWLKPNWFSGRCEFNPEFSSAEMLHSLVQWKRVISDTKVNKTDKY